MRVFLWFNFSAFQIEAFVHCLTHREGLARQDAINEDGLKQRFLWNRWEQDAHIVHLSCQLANDVFAVDIIDFAGKLLNVVVDEVLYRSGHYVGGWVRNPDAAGFFPDYAVKVLLSLLRSEGNVVNPSQMLEKIEGVHTE